MLIEFENKIDNKNNVDDKNVVDFVKNTKKIE